MIKIEYEIYVIDLRENDDAAGPLGNLGHTAPVLIPQYLRNLISFKKSSQKKFWKREVFVGKPISFKNKTKKKFWKP